jgi:hypothetical protein
MGFFQIISGSGTLALALGVWTMASRSEFGWAYWLFWASAVVAAVSAFWYGLTTFDPWPLRIGSEAVAGLFIGVVLPMLFRWMQKQKAKAGIVSPTISSGEPSAS